jgi:hypothetical protein
MNASGAYTTAEILAQLDDRAADYDFPMFDNAYIFFAAARLSLYRDRLNWALVMEVLGFSPKLNGWHHPDLADDELPGQTETFRQLAEVLVTGGPSPRPPPLRRYAPWGGGVLFRNAHSIT